MTARRRFAELFSGEVIGRDDPGYDAARVVWNGMIDRYPELVVRPANADAPMCFQCGVQMQRAGSCHACPSCGTTSGCS